MGRISPKLKKISPNSKYARAIDDPNDPIIGSFKQSVIAGELKRYKGATASAAKALGITKNTLEKYIIKSKVLQELVTGIVEEEIDQVEDALKLQINKGNLQAIMFYLRCKGKERGWIEKSELAVDMKPVTFKYTLAKGPKRDGGNKG